jgi:RNA polymerase sigma-70 factor, ECF subfamily
MPVNDRAALLRALHDEHGADLWRYVVRLTGDHQLAHDIVQEALLRAWQRPGVLANGHTSPRAWLFTVARNLVIDNQRSARVRREVPHEQLPEASRGDHTEGVLNSWLVSDALAQLSHDHRTVIVHAYYGRRTVADIATDLGLAPGTVKSRLHYALRALKLALQERGVTSQ